MISLLRARVDMKVSTYITDTDCTNYLNNSLAILDAILVSKFNDYKITPVLTSIVAGTNYLSLPPDFLNFRGLDIQYNTSNADGYLTVHQHSFQHRNNYNYPGSFAAIGPGNVTYRLQGQQVVLLPAAFAGQFNYRLWYTPDFIQLVNPSDTLQKYMDSQAWYEYAIADSAVKVLAMQGLDPSTFERQAAELKDHLIKLATPHRNAGEPIAVVDTRGEVGGINSNWPGNGWGM
jgi:hypothetical protein